MTEHIYCKGCRSLNTGCVFKDSNLDSKCPCVICIIKSMCRIGCPDYDVYRDLDIMLEEIKTNG